MPYSYIDKGLYLETSDPRDAFFHIILIYKRLYFILWKISNMISENFMFHART